jgi:hypothetical protein
MLPFGRGVGNETAEIFRSCSGCDDGLAARGASRADAARDRLPKRWLADICAVSDWLVSAKALRLLVLRKEKTS